MNAGLVMCCEDVARGLSIKITSLSSTTSASPKLRRRSGDRAEDGRPVVVAGKLIGVGVDRQWPWRSSCWVSRRRLPGRSAR